VGPLRNKEFYALALDLYEGLVFRGGIHVGALPVDERLARQVFFRAA
jgi:hypothetical protein